MADQVGENDAVRAPVKRKPRPPSRKGMGPTSTSFKPGVSGNPLGRPRKAMAFADRVRERLDPDMVIDLALAVAADTTLAPHERLRELWPLVDRGFIKPPTVGAHVVEASTSLGGLDLDALPLDEIERRLALLTSGIDLTAAPVQVAASGQQPTGVTVDDALAIDAACHEGDAPPGRDDT